MLGALNPSEETQLRQTIEMFEVITQSQPHDYQSLEILKEAYLKLGMEKEVVDTSKRIAQAYVQLGQLSSAILEYEIILQRHPDDKDAMEAMASIESKANNLTGLPPIETEVTPKTSTTSFSTKTAAKAATLEVDDGRQAMFKAFVEAKFITAGDFDSCWPTPSLSVAPPKAVEPFIHNLSERQLMPADKSLKLLADRSRLSYIPLDRYDYDQELGRIAPRAVCQRWCVLPFDKMSKTVLVATANPFNKTALAEIEAAYKLRPLLYLAQPVDLLRILGKVFR